MVKICFFALGKEQGVVQIIPKTKNVKVVKFFKYLRKIFRWEREVRSMLSAPREDPDISATTISKVMILSFILRWKSLLNSDRQFKSEPNISKILGAEKETICSDSTLNRALQWIDPQEMKDLWAKKLREIKRNKVHRSGTVGGYRVPAIDMSCVMSSDKISCRLCHDNIHKIVFGYMVGKKPHIFLGLEAMSPGEGETIAAERLITWIYETVGNWLQVLTVDGLYKAPFINRAKELGYEVVVKSDEYHTGRYRSILHSTTCSNRCRC